MKFHIFGITIWDYDRGEILCSETRVIARSFADAHLALSNINYVEIVKKIDEIPHAGIGPGPGF